MDTTAWIITTIMLIITMYLSYDKINEYKRSKETYQLVVVGVLCAIMIISLALRPLYYEIRNNTLIIKRLAGNIRIKKQDILSVENMDEMHSGILIRTFGIGGYFGYFGKYRSSSLGALNLYATRKNHRILISTRHMGKIIITPDDINMVSDLLL